KSFRDPARFKISPILHRIRIRLQNLAAGIQQSYLCKPILSLAWLEVNCFETRLVFGFWFAAETFRLGKDCTKLRLEHTLRLQLQMIDVDLDYVFLTGVYALPFVLPTRTDWKAHEHRRVN